MAEDFIGYDTKKGAEGHKRRVRSLLSRKAYMEKKEEGHKGAFKDKVSRIYHPFTE